MAQIGSVLRWRLIGPERLTGASQNVTICAILAKHLLGAFQALEMQKVVI
jgi:hypothetical protein